MRTFDPTQPYGDGFNSEEGFHRIQKGAIFSPTGDFLRVGDPLEYARWEPAEEPPSNTVTVTPPAEEPKRKLTPAEVTRIRTKFIKLYGKEEWEKLPVGNKINSAAEILG